MKIPKRGVVGGVRPFGKNSQKMSFFFGQAPLNPVTLRGGLVWTWESAQGDPGHKRFLQAEGHSYRPGLEGICRPLGLDKG